jgi:iron complex outermembrane recepter protein
MSRHFSVALLCLSASLPTLAFAQSAATPETSPGDIIVTAQKRAQNLQDVPAAVSVLSASQIEASGSNNIEALQSLVPTLTFRKGGTTLNSSLFLRGVGTINFSIAAEPSVAAVVDGVVLARSGEAFGDLYDIERIEVLRGPQGTLFGKNASAGVVNIVTKRPGADFGAELNVGVFEGGEYKFKGAIDAPLGSDVRSRLTAFYGEYDGNIRNLTTGKDINGYKRYGVRGVVEADASDALKFTLTADYRKSDDDCCGEVIGTAPTGAQAAPLNLLLSGVNLRGNGTRQVRNNLVTATEEESYGASIQGDLEIADHMLTSITAYRKWNNREIREGDWLDGGAAYVGINQLHDDGPQKSSTLSQEFRITSPAGGFFDYVGGLYYYRAKAERTFTRNVIQCLATTSAVDATGQRPCTPALSTFQNTSGTANFGSTFENYAAFGQGTINISEAFRLIAGVRYTKDNLSGFLNRVSTATVARPGINPAFSFAGKTDKGNFSGKAGVQFDVNDNQMAYVTYARGYKGPAYNIFFNMNATATNPIEAETANSYEVGLKNKFLDGRVILNVAGYYAKYKNFQANNFDLVAGVVTTRLTNAGTVSTRGFEIDLLLRPVDNLTFSGGLAYTDARIDAFRLPPGSPATATDRKGEQLPLSSKYKASFGGEYAIKSSEIFDVYLNADMSLQSKQVSDLQAAPATRQLLTIQGFTTVNASIGFADKNDRYRLTFIGKNLTDVSYASLITTGGPGGSLRYLIPREADRYFGATLRVKLGQ